MADPTVTQILLSAFAGGLCATVMGHAARRIEQTTARKETESRNAYVYLSKVSRVVAIGDILKTFGSSYAPIMQMVRDEYRKTNKDHVESAVLIAAILHVVLTDNAVISEKDREKILRILSELKKHEDEILDFALDHGLLAAIPTQSVPEYIEFMNGVHAIKRIVFECVLAFELSLPPPSPEDIYGWWISGRDFYVSATRLSKLLVAHGNIDQKRADAILVRYRGLEARSILRRSENEKLFAQRDALMEFARKALNKTAQKNSSAS